jgi:O-methyltransferase involved in polyketide biosynthesis
VLTFTQPIADGGRAELAEGAKAVGEPWRTYFEPAEIEALLREAGFSTVTFLDRDEAMRRYYVDRSDGLVAPRRVSIVTAVV